MEFPNHHGNVDVQISAATIIFIINILDDSFLDSRTRLVYKTREMLDAVLLSEVTHWQLHLRMTETVDQLSK